MLGQYLKMKDPNPYIRGIIWRYCGVLVKEEVVGLHLNKHLQWCCAPDVQIELLEWEWMNEIIIRITIHLGGYFHWENTNLDYKNCHCKLDVKGALLWDDAGPSGSMIQDHFDHGASIVINPVSERIHRCFFDTLWFEWSWSSFSQGNHRRVTHKVM